MLRPYKIPESSKEGIPARFGGKVVNIEYPDKGTDAEAELTLTGPAAETVRNLLVAAGGTNDEPGAGHENLWSISVAGGFALAKQKHVKATAVAIPSDPTVTEGEKAFVDDETAWQLIVDAATEIPKVTVREMSGGPRKESAKQAGKKEARAEIAAKATETMAEMTDAEREAAEALLAKLGIAVA